MIHLAFGLFTTLAAQTFDVYRPPAAPPTGAPLVIFVHGGAWVGGAKAEYRELGVALAGAGFCAALIDYHLAPAFKHPRPVEDLETARRALVKSPGAGCDGGRVVMIGHSAGAHAIAFWAARHAEAVAGFVGLEGIYDVAKLARRWPEYPAQFLDAEFGQSPAARLAASPARLDLKNKARWLLVHAGGDELVDAPQTESFADRLKIQHIAAERFDPGPLDHFAVIESLRDQNSATFRRVVDFIRARTKLAAPTH